jgi:hypothetical protein
MKTTVYLYNEYTDKDGNFKQLPLAKPLKEDKYLKNVLWSTDFDWIFNDSKYGKTLKDITLKARTHAHGSLEYNDIKMRMPGYTWAGTIDFEDCLDEDNQIYEKRKRRSNGNITPNGLICIEFDDVEPKEVNELIQKALMKFPHLVYAGRTLSNKLFCMHRADDKMNARNYIRYFKELAVLYYNELGLNPDVDVNDVARCRYMCDQFGGRASMEYCDFAPTENTEIEYDKIFGQKETSGVKRVSEYVPLADETIYIYDKDKGFYYGHGKNHKMQISDLIVPIPTITQMINTLLALGKTRDEIKELWKNEFNYYNYNTNSRDLNDVLRLTQKFKLDNDEYTVGNQTYLFLQMFFPHTIGLNLFFLAANEFLCDRYYDFLFDAIASHNKILVHGDTGIGKTFFANRLNEDKNVIVIVPYLAHMDNYPAYHQMEYDKDSTDMISNGVIIWDRFIKFYDKGLIDKNSVILVDESHKLFLDQTYRTAAIRMNQILKDITNHICYMSATPINEVGVDISYRFEKDRRKVPVNYLKIIPEEETWPSSTLMINAMLHLIYGNINYYDHIFIASDIFAQKIYDRLYGKYDCQLIRASQKDSKEYLDLMSTQLLKHKIIIGTCISYESLNFNNRNEKILTIADMNEKTTAEIITQISGRVRYSSNKVYLIELIKFIESTDYKQLADFYNKLEEIKSKYNLYSKKHYVQSYYEELETVEKWYYENSNIDVIKEKLPLYIKWSESEILAHNLSDKSPLNERVREYIIDHTTNYDNNLINVDIIIDEIDLNTFMFFDDNDFIKIDETGQSAYIIRESIRGQQYEYAKLNQYISYEKINNMIKNAHAMPKGIHNEILHIIDIIKLSQADYDEYYNELETYKNSIGYTIGYQILDKTIKNINNIRKTYHNCYNKDELYMYNSIFDKLVDKKIKLFQKKQGIWSDIGSSNTKKVVITDKFKNTDKYGLTIGQEFESCKLLAEYVNRQKDQISRWIKSGWVQKK